MIWAPWQEDEGYVIAADWTAGLPGLDADHPEQPDLRAEVDRMLVVHAVMTFWRPDIRQARHDGGFGKVGNNAAMRLMDWLTPAGDERWDWIDAFRRRKALVLALAQYAPGADPEVVVHSAQFIYGMYRKPGLTPAAVRQPLRDRIREPAPA
jgi:hypothetical protein